jgi:hypothetical protein
MSTILLGAKKIGGKRKTSLSVRLLFLNGNCCVATAHGMAAVSASAGDDFIKSERLSLSLSNKHTHTVHFYLNMFLFLLGISRARTFPLLCSAGWLAAGYVVCFYVVRKRRSPRSVPRAAEREKSRQERERRSK